jgi:hypothetical protein
MGTNNDLNLMGMEYYREPKVRGPNLEPVALGQGLRPKEGRLPAAQPVEL